MANLTVCDRCKRPINGILNDRHKGVFRVSITDLEKDHKGERSQRLELCHFCKEGLLTRWLTTPPDNSNPD